MYKMEMDANDVLKQFTRLCNADYALLQHYLASNAALEWFGRTIRGRTNIYPYYRFDLCQQYEHNFEKAEKCSAFECKPSHMQTRIIAEADKVHAQAQSNTLDDILSTPLQRISTPTLPKVGKEKHFISTPDIPPTSSPERDNVTPPQNITKQLREESDDTPPTKKMKLEASSSCAGDAASSGNVKHTEDSIYDKLACDTRQNPTPELGQGDCILPSEDLEETYSSSDTGYSDLFYLESIGFLDNRNKVKHRGIVSTEIPSDSDCTSPGISSSSRNDLTNSANMRKTKLKLSYRMRWHDSQLQFALIVYEHLSRNPITRRNLFHEFQNTNSNNDDATPNTKAIVSPSTKKQTNSLKRSHRLL